MSFEEFNDPSETASTIANKAAAEEEDNEDARVNQRNNNGQHFVQFDNEGSPRQRFKSSKMEWKSQIALHATGDSRRAIRRPENPHFDLATGRRIFRQQTVRQLTIHESSQTATATTTTRPSLNRVVSTVLRRGSSERRRSHGGSVLVDPNRNNNTPHYRLRAHSEAFRRKPFWNYCVKPMEYTTFISGYLRWSFRASFFEVGVTSFLAYMSLILCFAGLLQLIAVQQPQCFVANEGFAAGVHFMDLFHLSWTTFSTVGYGVIAARVDHGSHNEGEEACLGINSLMAFEAFLGVLFGGIASAVILGKVSRVQSIARILWSHPICVRYGVGVSGPDDDDDGDDGEEYKSDKWRSKANDVERSKARAIPCPVLEFRVVNELSAVKGGEIVDASVTVVATTFLSKEGFGPFESFQGDMKKAALGQSPPKFGIESAAKKVMKAGIASTNAAVKVGTASTSVARKAAISTGAALMGAGKATSKATGTIVQRLNHQLSRSPNNSTRISAESLNFEEQADTEEVQPFRRQEEQQELEQRIAKHLVERLAAEQIQAAGVSALQESRTAVLVHSGEDHAPPRVFHKLNLETDSHPFMKRIWNIRHVLDASSPLLSNEARKMIEENDGFWPEELNHHTAIRQNLHFHELIVNFSGTTNVTGSSVFSQKVYSFVDVNIGYTFAQVLHVSGDGKLVVDAELLNDVREQRGGGAEPLLSHSGTETDSPFSRVVDATYEAGRGAAVGVTRRTVYVGQAVGDKALDAADGVVGTIGKLTGNKSH